MARDFVLNEARYQSGMLSEPGLSGVYANLRNKAARTTRQAQTRMIRQALFNLPDTFSVTSVEPQVVNQTTTGAGETRVEVVIETTARSRAGKPVAWKDETTVVVDADGRVVSASLTPRPEEMADTSPPSSEPTFDIPFVASPAWTADGRPGIWLPSGHWGMFSAANVAELASASGPIACTTVKGRRSGFTSSFFRLDSPNDTGAQFCADRAGLQAAGRWEEFLETARTASPQRPMILPAPETDSGALAATSSIMEKKSLLKRARVRPQRANGRFSVTTTPRSGTKRPMGAYCRECTWNYAQYWWNKRNSYYNNYSGSGGSAGDCSNYASQLLYQGGFRNFPLSGWYYFASDRAAGVAWIRVTDQMMHFYNSGYTRGVGSAVAVRGDMVFYDYKADGGADHESIVTGGNASGSGYPVITQHDTDYLTERVQDQITRKPGMRIIYLQVLSTNG